VNGTHHLAIEGYSDDALNGAIRDLTGRHGSWEKGRLEALKAERSRRDSKRRGKEAYRG